MPAVRIEQKRVWIDQTPYPLLSGEVHFWRLHPASWQAVLRQVRAMGLDIVASYVCWEYHEIAPGRFDFTGETDSRRDLIGFIRLVAEEGLKLIIRPGPYIYSEWANGGIPARCVPYHRLHPEFKREAALYMAAVTGALLPHLATRGGPILLLQAENEPHPWPHIYEGQLGLGEEPGPFQTFLAERYGSIEALNDAWEVELAGFESARAVTRPGIPERAYLNRYLDYIRFQHAYTAEAVRWTADQYRELGVDIPILANVYVGEGIQNWRELEEACDLVGPDLYPTAGFRAGPEEHFRHFLLPLRYARACSALPWIPEFQAGIWHGGHYDTGPLPANHVLMTCCSALLAGVAGWNWYMLVNRDNWQMSPINEWGQPQQDLATAFRQCVRLFHEASPPDLEKLTATAVTVDPLHQTARLPDQSVALLRALYEADIDYESFDLATGRIACPLLFYGGGAWLGRAGQERLKAYVEGGGTLICFQETPHFDDAFAPLNLLDIPRPARILGASSPQQVAIHLGPETVLTSPGAFFVYDSAPSGAPGEPIRAERAPDAAAEDSTLRGHIALPVGATYTIGYRLPRGEGQIVCLGVPPTPALVSALHRWLGFPIFSQAAAPGVSTALFRQSDARAWLVAVSASEESHDVRVRLDREPFGRGLWLARDLISGEELTFSPDQAGILWLHLPPKSGTIIRLTLTDTNTSTETQP